MKFTRKCNFKKSNRCRGENSANSILTIFSKNCALPQRNASDLKYTFTPSQVSRLLQEKVHKT